MKRRRRNILIIAAIAIIGAMALPTLWPAGRAFDRAAWLDDKKVQQGVRQAMADRIIALRMLHGMRRDDVVAMLGEPPATEYFSDWNLVYWLGPERGYMSIDSEWLVVRLDSNGRVSECRIVRD